MPLVSDAGTDHWVLTSFSLYYKLLYITEQEGEMQSQESEGQGITPEQGWNSIQATLDRSRSSMYMAGWTTIMIMWGAIIAVANLSQYAVETWAPVFASDYPWFPGPLWSTLGAIGMVGSCLIGYRASKRNAVGPSATTAGLKVFAYWMTAVAAAFVIPAASGMWTGDVDYVAVVGVGVGTIALAYILFGIMHHPAIALVGLGIAASYYGPVHLAGNAAPVVSAAIILAVVAAAWWWTRKSDVA